MTNTRIHWARILLGGLLAEVALILAIVPLGLRFGDNFLHYTAPPGSFVMCFLGALWVCRRIESHFILHGTLLGVVAALIYVGLTRAQPEPFAYIVAHALKVVGGACGGFVAQLASITVSGATCSRLVHCLTSSCSRFTRITFRPRPYTFFVVTSFLVPELRFRRG